MIKWAGIGVAMGNAFDVVKETIDYVTRTNEEHGVWLRHCINLCFKKQGGKTGRRELNTE